MKGVPLESRQLPSLKSVLTTALILFLIGAVGLTLLFILTVPTLGPRWLLFFLTTLVVSGIALPFTYLLNRRLADRLPVSAAILVREALFFGIYIDLVIWLQFGKVLNFALGVFLLAGFVIIEALLRWRERNRFTPDAEDEES
jgi:hypothetical protein